MELNYLTVVFMPLVGFLFTALMIALENLFSVKLNSKLASLFVVGFTSISSALALKLFLLRAFIAPESLFWYDLKFANWVFFGESGAFSHSFGPFALKWGLCFDSISITMLLVITFVSLLVQLYATEYMSHDVNRTRFLGYLALFVFFMIVLVSSDNFVQMFIGWEGVGLVSYLLINFWYTRVEAARSALKAVGVNKFGDYALVMAMFFTFYVLGTVDYDEVFYFAHVLPSFEIGLLGFQFNYVSIIAFFILIAAVGKSAQLGLHTWLPDAMEGPTPVSALIHAATMVTAGVYLLVRCSPLLELSPAVLALTALIGVTTALFGASTALCQNDLKKVIAYSTCSQLGYMVCACGLSAYSAAMFHLVTHAFFKALLFLCAGSVIHALADEQDMRKMGGLAKVLPFTYLAMAIGSLSLGGFPFLAGFYSKDLILEIAASTHNFVGMYVFVVGVLAAIFTTLYSVRLTFLTFLTKSNSFRKVVEGAHEAPFFMALPLAVLSILSIAAGWLLKPVFVGGLGELNPVYWKGSIFVDTANYASRSDLHELGTLLKNVPTLAVFTAFVLASLFYWFFSSVSPNMSLYGRLLAWQSRNKLSGGLGINALLSTLLGFYWLLNKKWYFDIVYNHYLVRSFYLFGYESIFKAVDRGLLNFMIWPTGVNSVLRLTRLLKRIHSDTIYVYLLYLLFGLTVMILLILGNT